MKPKHIGYWLEHKYPLTIIHDRYDGCYSGAKYLAFPLEYSEVPLYASGDDVACGLFWDDYKEPVDKGATPGEAYADLKAKMFEQAWLSVMARAIFIMDEE